MTSATASRATSSAPVFSLADLEAFDTGAPAGARERRFLCPLCGEGKPKNAAHRSLCANIQTGAWNCKRCKATGKLADFWTDRPKSNPRERAREQRRQLSVLPDEKPKSTPEIATDWRERIQGARPLEGTPGAAYLQKRGITPEVARDSGVLFAPAFYGAAAVVFAICDQSGAQIGASGRYIATAAAPKTRIAGSKRDGLFATPRALQGKSGAPVIVTEAPLDALSLAMAGYPALALCGTSAPAWIHLACGLKRVLLAFDADEPGDNAAAALAAHLTRYGAQCERLRPEGGKDWNEALQGSGRDWLADWLALRVLAA